MSVSSGLRPSSECDMMLLVRSREFGRLVRRFLKAFLFSAQLSNLVVSTCSHDGIVTILQIVRLRRLADSSHNETGTDVLPNLNMEASDILRFPDRSPVHPIHDVSVCKSTGEANEPIDIFHLHESKLPGRHKTPLRKTK